MLCAGAVERPRPDPQGAAFRVDRAGGNHGEDVKELYYYLDFTPTHSYLKALYKYPQAAFPYEALVRGNQQRGKQDAELALLDTGSPVPASTARRGGGTLRIQADARSPKFKERKII